MAAEKAAGQRVTLPRGSPSTVAASAPPVASSPSGGRQGRHDSLNHLRRDRHSSRRARRGYGPDLAKDRKNRDARDAARRHTLAMTDLDLNAAQLAAEIDAQGYAVRHVLDAAECRDVGRMWDEEARFRKRIIMQQHAYGRGEYRYLAYPLPDTVARLRQELYPPLAALANGWRRTLGQPVNFRQPCASSSSNATQRVKPGRHRHVALRAW